jgi:hypothetical protein
MLLAAEGFGSGMVEQRSSAEADQRNVVVFRCFFHAWFPSRCLKKEEHIVEVAGAVSGEPDGIRG